MAGSIMQYVLYLAVLVVLAIPLGTYMKKVKYGEKTIFSSIFTPCERIVCKVLHVQDVYKRQIIMFTGRITGTVGINVINISINIGKLVIIQNRCV